MIVLLLLSLLRRGEIRAYMMPNSPAPAAAPPVSAAICFLIFRRTVTSQGSNCDRISSIRLNGGIYANSHNNSINNNNLIAKIKETNQSLKDINNTLEKLSKNKKKTDIIEMRRTRIQKRHIGTRKRSTRRRRMRGGADYEIINVLDASPELRTEIEKHLQICWPETNPVQKAFESASLPEDPSRIDLMYKRNDDGNIIFSRIILQWVDQESIYIQETCVSPEQRSKGHYKNSLSSMRTHYASNYPGIFKHIRNKAEYETIGDIDHLTRLLVFHKLGYRFLPIIKDYGEDNPLSFKLKGTGEIVSLVRQIESTNRSSFKYVVKTRDGEEKVIDLTEIEFCQAPIYEPKTVTVKKGDEIEIREPVRHLGEAGLLTRNSESGKEEVVSWPDIINLKWEKKGNSYNPDDIQKIYCPLSMNI